jgi:hypothetical protein
LIQFLNFFARSVFFFCFFLFFFCFFFFFFFFFFHLTFFIFHFFCTFLNLSIFFYSLIQYSILFNVVFGCFWLFLLCFLCWFLYGFFSFASSLINLAFLCIFFLKKTRKIFSSSYMPVSYKECGNATDALFSRLMLNAVPTQSGAFFSGAHCTLLGDPPRSGGRRSASRVDISHTRTVAGLCRSHIRSSLDLKEDELAMTGLSRIFRKYIRTSPLCDADPSDDEINEMVQQISAKADTSDNKSYKTTAKSLTPSLQAFLRSDFATASPVPSNAHAVAAEALARFDEACVQSSALFGLARKQERKAARAATMRALSAAVAAAEATSRGAAVHTPERRLADKAVALAKRLRDDTKAFFSRFTKLEALDFKYVTTANRLQLASMICFPGLPSGLRVLIMTDPDRAGVVCHLAAVRALARDKAISDQGDAPPEQVELDRLCNQLRAS